MKRTPAETAAVAAVTFAVYFIVVPAVMGYCAVRGYFLRPGFVSGKRGTL